MSSLSQIRDHYIRCFRPQAKIEAVHFADGSPEERVKKAALARTSDDRKHKHQWRIPPALLIEFKTRLLDRLDELTRMQSFPELHAAVYEAKLKGVGELTVYDTAVRIGAGKRIEPDEVYLHAGTRKGAARLGWNVRRSSIPLSEIPPALTSLSPSEIEDLLCIYADYFGPNAKGILPAGCHMKSRQGCGPDYAGQEGCR